MGLVMPLQAAVNSHADGSPLGDMRLSPSALGLTPRQSVPSLPGLGSFPTPARR